MWFLVNNGIASTLTFLPHKITCCVKGRKHPEAGATFSSSESPLSYHLGLSLASPCPARADFLFFFNFYFYFILLYNTVLVLPYTDMNQPWVYMSSQSWPPSHLPSHIISLDHPRAPAPSILYPVSNIDWRFVSYLIVYMFQCHSPKSSHPLPLPQSLKVRSIHLCPFCCLA